MTSHVSATGDQAAGAAPGPADAVGMVIERDVPVRVDDGSCSAPTCSGRPTRAATRSCSAMARTPRGWPSRTATPTVAPMVSRAPGGGRRLEQPRTQNWEVVDPEKWVPDGYACVRVDSRGAGRSPGVLEPFSPRETRDFYECIEWAGGQPWSTGKVGLNGISYYAMNQWHVAGAAAAAPGRDLRLGGGRRLLPRCHPPRRHPVHVLRQWYAKQVTVVQHGRGERGAAQPGHRRAGGRAGDADRRRTGREPRVTFGEQIGDQPLDDEFYRQRSADLPRSPCRCCPPPTGAARACTPAATSKASRRAASAQKWLEVHGLEHWTHFYTDYGADLQKRFFACFLHGDDRGWREQPPVQLQVRTLDGFIQRGEQEWPLARTQWPRLYLRPAQRTLDTAPPPADERVSYAAAGDGVTFTAPPLPADTEITGPVAARLYVSSSSTDADLFLVLRVFAPGGEEVTFPGAIDPHTPVAQGWLRMSHRKLDPGLSTAVPPVPRTRRDAAADSGRGLPGRRGDLADQRRGPGRLPDRADHPGPGLRAPYRRRAPAGLIQERADRLRPVPARRPARTGRRSLAGSAQTLCTGGSRAAYLLLPVIPPG